MGIDCPDIRQVIHWGMPEDTEMYEGLVGMGGWHVHFCLKTHMIWTDDTRQKK